jgi:outer membrane lipoprotein carrier protein
MIKFKLTTIFLLLFSTVVIAEETKDPLQAFLDGFKSMEANFIQKLINENSEVLETTEGTLRLQQPRKFYWSYTTPYTQKIISNGEVIWVYDEDLEQLTIRNMGNAIDETPAGVILGKKDVNEHFIQVDMGNIEGFDWIELSPKNQDAQYKNIRLGFDKTKLGMMVILDNLGQTTRIDFSDVKKNTELPASLFEFEAPEGVDVIDERQAATGTENNS